MPHLCIDPIIAGAHLLTQLQTFTSRTISPLDSAVLTIGEFHAGTMENIIPEEAHLNGTLLTLTPETRELAFRRIDEMSKSLDLAFGVSTTIENIEGYPVHVNDSAIVDHMKTCVDEILGTDAAHIGRPRMGAEDFAYFCQKWPGAMVGLGCHDPAKGFQYALHSPNFNMDERILDVGVRLMGQALVHFIEKAQSL
jgi:amidohydrolase